MFPHEGVGFVVWAHLELLESAEVTARNEYVNTRIHYPPSIANAPGYARENFGRAEFGITGRDGPCPCD